MTMNRIQKDRLRRRVRWGRLFSLVFIFSLFVTGLTVGGMYIVRNISWLLPTNSASAPPAVSVPEPPKAAPVKFVPDADKRMNVLVVGLDDGEGEGGSFGQHADGIFLCNLDPDAGMVRVMILPRETKINLPGKNTNERLSEAYSIGGIDLLQKSAEHLLGITVQHYVILDWRAFVKLIDVMGGVDLYVEQNMFYEDLYANLNIQLKQGFQRLNGTQAGGYVRFREAELGEIGRIQRQQRFIKALMANALSFSTIPKTPALASAFDQYVKTDIPPFSFVKLLGTMRKYSATKIQTEILPGAFQTEGGLNYWVVSDTEMRRITDGMFMVR